MKIIEQILMTKIIQNRNKRMKNKNLEESFDRMKEKWYISTGNSMDEDMIRSCEYGRERLVW